MDLRTWLDQQGISKTEFAKRIGLAHVQSLFRYFDGKQVPRPKYMAAIKRETGGAVTADDFTAKADAEDAA